MRQYFFLRMELASTASTEKIYPSFEIDVHTGFAPLYSCPRAQFQFSTLSTVTTSPITMTVGNLPHLQLVCLKTADSKDTQEIVRGKATIIDFWTTKCTKCPDALDKLDEMAKDPKYENVQFVSICCDQLDGARSIIEKDDDLRWQNVDHYFMSQADKEQAKKELGFKSVPFYVVLDEDGTITQKGNSKAIDFEEVPGVVRPEPAVLEQCSPSQCEEEKKQDDDDDGFTLDFQLDFAHHKFKDPPEVERIFSLDDDF